MAGPYRPFVGPGLLIRAATALPLTLALSGCIGTGFTVPFFGRSETVTVTDAAPTRSAAKPTTPGRYPLAHRPRGLTSRQLVEAVENESQTTSKYPGAKTAKKISTAFRHAADSLTASHKVVDQDDATRLASRPDHLSPELFISSARLLEHQGEAEKAASHYQKALEIDPVNRGALIGYARLQHRLGHLQEAVRLYGRAIENDPEDAIALNDLGLCLARMGQLEQAISTIDKAVQAQPTSPRYRNNLATLLVEGGRFDEALAQLEQVHGTAKAHHNLGCLLQQQGRNRLAMQHFAKALEADPNLSVARAMLAQLQGQAQNRPMASFGPQASPSMAPAPTAPASRNIPNAASTFNRAASYQAPQRGSPAPAPGPANSAYFLQQEHDRVGPFGYRPLASSGSPTLRMPEARARNRSAGSQPPPMPSGLAR